MNTQRHGFLLIALCLLFIVPPALAAADDAKPAKDTPAKDKPVNATVRAADGLSIAYDVRGKGDTALVFVHGWCGDREYWKHQLDAFAGDYRVVAIDLAGHGASGKDRKEWSVLELAGDVEAVIKDLRLKRVILIGHSMGGPISLEVARRMPGTVVAVIGADTLHNAEHKVPDEMWAKVIAAFEADFKAMMRAGIRGMLPEKHDPKLFEWIAAKSEAQDQKMALALFRDLPGLDTKALLKAAKVPVRCINAAPAFEFAVPTDSEINKKYADFKAVIMEGVGHYPMLEKPEEFNEKLREILKEFEPKKAAKPGSD